MKTLYLRIYLTVLVVLALFGAASAWLFHGHLQQERSQFETVARERFAGMAMLLERTLPPAHAPAGEQQQALSEWAQRLSMALALEDAQGQDLASSAQFERRSKRPGVLVLRFPLSDGRVLLVARNPRPGPGREPAPEGGPEGMPGKAPRADAEGSNLFPALGQLQVALPPWLARTPNPAVSLVTVLVLLFVGVAAGAYPVVRRLTRRLEALKAGVEQFGAGDLSRRVDEHGRDEVAALAVSFNQAAQRIEGLLAAQRDLLANASHELRSPLTRLKMALSLLPDSPSQAQARLREEIHTDIAELDALVDEILLSSRLNNHEPLLRRQALELGGVLAEEGARSGVELQCEASPTVWADERLLRRAMRNLLENAQRYGGGDVSLTLQLQDGQAEIQVCDRGPGVPEALRERIFEAFFRLSGHAEVAGGVGLGLHLVRQIAQAHEGSVRCLAREGGGSCFVLRLPLGSA
ncbi:ATP-binding protein [Roseateles sp. BYS180W]|uniref:histidine kinase n=1 Tax=Roseateles rivi TaxID=3299028 RepID=A0ABW7FUR3_9BURK